MKRNVLAVIFVGVLCFSKILNATHSLYENAQAVYHMLHPELEESVLRKDIQSIFARAFIIPAVEGSIAPIMLNKGMDRAYCVQIYRALQRMQKELLESKKHTFFDSIERMKLSPDLEFQEKFLEYYVREHPDMRVDSITEHMHSIYATVKIMDRLPNRVATFFCIPASVHIAIFGILHRALEDLYNRTHLVKSSNFSSATTKVPQFKIPRLKHTPKSLGRPA